MNFFQTLQQNFPDAFLSIKVMGKNGVLSLEVLPLSKKDNKVKPLIVTGTPGELDEQFFEMIKPTITESMAAIVNMDEHKSSVTEAQEDAADTKPKSTSKAAPKKSVPAKSAPKAATKKPEAPKPISQNLFEESGDQDEETPDTPEVTEEADVESTEE